MRFIVTLLLIVSSVRALGAQEHSCAATADVETLDPSSFPNKARAAKALSQLLFTLRYTRSLATRNVVELGFVVPYDFTTVPLWTPVAGLPPKPFVAIDRKHSIPVLSAESRSAPLRIVFVVDNGRRVTAAERQVESVALKAILSFGRREDSFALLTAGGPRVAVPFGSSRQAIELALEGLRQPAHKGPQGEKVSGALLEAAQSFGTPHEGDAIILLARTLTGNMRAEVRSALTSRGIRLFCLGLGAMLESVWGGYSTSPLVTLSEETGGGWEQADPLPRRGLATDTNLQVARKEARDLYDMATTYYVLRLEHTGPHVVIGLSPHTLDQMPWGRVVYPVPLPVCP